MVDRLERISEALKREISILLQEDINDPRIGNITITRVETSRDLRFAKVFYVIYSSDVEKDQIVKGLKKASSFIRGKLAERISMKFTPRISFHYDDTDAKKESMDKIFEKIKKEKDEDA